MAFQRQLLGNFMTAEHIYEFYYETSLANEDMVLVTYVQDGVNSHVLGLYPRAQVKKNIDYWYKEILHDGQIR